MINITITIEGIEDWINFLDSINNNENKQINDLANQLNTQTSKLITAENTQGESTNGKSNPS